MNWLLILMGAALVVLGLVVWVMGFIWNRLDDYDPEEEARLTERRKLTVLVAAGVGVVLVEAGARHVPVKSVTLTWKNVAVDDVAVTNASQQFKTVVEASTDLKTWRKAGEAPYRTNGLLILSNRPWPAEFYRAYNTNL